MSAAPERLNRLLQLLPWLIERPGVSVADAAAAFGVTVRQLRSDLELLFVCGLPGHGPGDLIDISWEEGGGIEVGFDAGLRRPLRLLPDEALALIVALRTLAETPGLDAGGSVARTLAKLETAAGDAAAAASRLAVDVEADAGVLGTVRLALDRGRRLHLAYAVAARDETTEREVDPMRLLLVEGRTYLEAWCRRAEAVRLFRLDRVERVQIVDRPAAPPPQARPRDLDEGLFVPGPDDPRVVLDLPATARWVADYYPGEVLAEGAGGRVTVRLAVGDPAWVRRLLLSLGPDAVVVDPPALAEAVRAEAAAALAAYRTGD